MRDGNSSDRSCIEYDTAPQSRGTLTKVGDNLNVGWEASCTSTETALFGVCLVFAGMPTYDRRAYSVIYPQALSGANETSGILIILSWFKLPHRDRCLLLSTRRIPVTPDLMFISIIKYFGC